MRPCLLQSVQLVLPLMTIATLVKVKQMEVLSACFCHDEYCALSASKFQAGIGRGAYSQSEFG